MTDLAYRRARCPHCKAVCEHTRAIVLVDGHGVLALECSECGVRYAEDDQTPSESGPVEALRPSAEDASNGCPLCGSDTFVHRLVRDPSGAELPATDCADCEQLCLSTRVATDHERVESERNQALEAKCALLAVSLRQADARLLAAEKELGESERARADLAQQLLLCERKAESMHVPKAGEGEP